MIDYIGALMKELGVPLTRKNYLDFCGVDEPLSAEEESLLPFYAQLDFLRREYETD